jgi:hypothetical protein
MGVQKRRDNLMDFCLLDGTNAIAAWARDDLSDEGRATFDSRVRLLRQAPIWSDKWVKKRVGSKDIFEVRFADDAGPIRPLGFFGPDRETQFTFLIGAREDNGRLIPRNADRAAIERMEEVRADGSRIKPHEDVAAPAAR